MATYIYIYIFFWPCREACGILVPRSRGGACAPCSGAAESFPLDRQGSPSGYILIIFNFYLFVYLFMAVLGLRFCARAFSIVAASGGHSSLRCAGPLTIAASRCGAQAQ